MTTRKREASPESQRFSRVMPAGVGAATALTTFVIATVSLDDGSVVRWGLTGLASLVTGAVATFSTAIGMGRTPGRRELLRSKLEEAMRAAALGDTRSARKTFDSIRTAASQLGDEKLGLDALLSTAELELNLGNVHAARDELKRAKDVAGGGVSASSRLLRVEADILRAEGQYSSADEMYRKAALAAETEHDAAARAYDLLGLAEIDRVLGRFEDARQKLAEATAIFDRLHGHRAEIGQGRTRLCRARVEFDVAPKQALAHVDDAERSFKRAGDELGRLECVIMSNRRQTKNDGEAAIEVLNAVRDRADEYESISLHAQCWEAIADWKRDRSGTGSEPEAAYCAAFDLYKKSGDQLKMADVLKSRAQLAWAENKVDAARQLYDRAYDLYEKLDAKRGLAGVTLERAHSERIRSNNDTARELYGRARLLCEQARWPRGEIAVSVGLSELEAHAGHFDKARTALLRAAAEAERLGDDELLAGVLIRLGQVEIWLGRAEESRGRYRKAGELRKGVGRMRALAQLMLADLERAVGNSAEGQRQLAPAEDFYLKGSDELMKANVLRVAGDLLCDSNVENRTDARTNLAQAITLYETYGGNGEYEGLGEAELGLARIDLVDGDFSGADKRCRAAIDHFEQATFLVGLVDAQILLGEVLLGSPSPSDDQRTEASHVLEVARKKAEKAGYLLGEARAHLALSRVESEPVASRVRHLHVASYLFSRIGVAVQAAACDRQAVDTFDKGFADQVAARPAEAKSAMT